MASEYEWIDEGLEGIDPVIAEKFKKNEKALSWLDKAITGLDKDTKIKILRTMINMDIDPGDPANVLLVLYGYIEAAGELIPEEIRKAAAELQKQLNVFIEEAQMLPDIVASVHKRLKEDIEKEAIRLAEAATRAASVEELEKHRLRLMAVTEDALKKHVANSIVEQQRLSTDVLLQRSKIINIIAVVVILIVGWLPGAAWGAFHPILSGDTKTNVQYGREFRQMYPDMPASMQQWVAEWSKKHPQPQ